MTDDNVLVYDRLEDLAGIRDDWNRLLAVTPHASFFQSLDWLTIYWQHFGSMQQLRVLVVTDSHRPIGIVPLASYREQSRLGPVRVLGYPLDNWGTRFGPIGPNPKATLVAALRWMRQIRHWDVVDLRWGVDPIASATAAAFRQAGLSVRQTATTELTWIDLADGWDAYWANRSGKLRNNVERSEKRLARLGRVESIHSRPTAQDPCWELYRQCEQVASRSWQAATATGNTLCDPQCRAFLREVHRVAAARGSACINLLTLNDVPIAFNYDYAYDNRVFGLRTGFDPAISHAGAGTALLARSVREYAKQGVQIIDLGETPSRYKTRWRNGSAPSYRFRHYPRFTWRAQTLRLRRSLFDWPLAPTTPLGG